MLFFDRNTRIWLLIRIALLSPVLVLLLWIASYRLGSARTRRRRRHEQQDENDDCIIVLGFYHPYCGAGGGGERVLWKMIQVLGELVADKQGVFPSSRLKVVVYTIDPPSPTYKQDLLQHVKERFALEPSARLQLEFVHLHEYADYLKPSPRLSLLVESYGTMKLAAQALAASSSSSSNTAPHLPDWWIDTTGCAFTYAVANLLYGCNVMAYVHYPTISTDMLQLVWDQSGAKKSDSAGTYNHSATIASSRVKTAAKLLYYLLFAFFYGTVGSLAKSVLVNSTWTWGHIQSLWKIAAWRGRIHTVYPPCRLSTDLSSTEHQQREPVVLSIGQFRPEKNHALQIQALATFRTKYPNHSKGVKLVLLGSCRKNAADQERLQSLKELAKQLKVSDRVEFVVNQPYSVVQEWLGRASVGIHTMWNEHFGIGIVEMMAAGMIVVAHNSGGPKSDIVTPHQSGFLATTADEYADAIYQALTLDSKEANEMRQRAQESSLRFSDDVFAESFKEAIVKSKMLQK